MEYAGLNSKGMSLLEIMISMLILTVVSMALLQTSLLGYQENLRNSLRDEAIRMADKTISDLRARPYTQAYSDPLLNSGTTVTTVTRSIRSAQKDYTVTTTINDISANTKQVTAAVAWQYRGTPFSHSTTVILGIR